MIKKILQHPSLQYADDLADICRPLLRLDINYFAHGFIDKNGKFSALNNNASFMEHYLKNKYYNADIHMALENNFGQYVIWDEVGLLGESAKMDAEGKAFGIDHTFTIVEKAENETNYFHFANKGESRLINNVYLTNIDLLKSFIIYFKKMIMGSKKLSEAYNILFSLDNDKGSYNTESHILLPNQQQKLGFLNEIGIIRSHGEKRDMLKEKIAMLNISSREKECLYLFIYGKSANDIAGMLNLSKRTVETYLLNIKEKLEAPSKQALIEKILSSVL